MGVLRGMMPQTGNNGTSQITLNGTRAALNAYLNDPTNIQYLNGTAHTAGEDADTIQVSVNDLGNTGSGGPLSGFDTAAINITAVNDAPVLSGANDLAAIDEDPVNTGNVEAVAFTFADAEVGATYAYSFTSDGGGGEVTGGGTIATATDQVGGIDVRSATSIESREDEAR